MNEFQLSSACPVADERVGRLQVGVEQIRLAIEPLSLVAVAGPERGAQPVRDPVCSLGITREVLDCAAAAGQRSTSPADRPAHRSSRRCKDVDDGSCRQDFGRSPKRKQTGRVGQPARDAVELQFAGKLMLLRLSSLPATSK